MRLFELLMRLASNEEQKIPRSRLVEKALQFLPYLTSQNISATFKWYLEQGKLVFTDFSFISKECLVKEHKFTGKQRRAIMRHMLKTSGQVSERLSNSDDLKTQKQCLACLPKLKDKEMVWLKVVDGKVSEQELELIADDLYETSHNDSCQVIADWFFEVNLEQLETKCGESYALRFYQAFCPIVLARQRDLEKLERLYADLSWDRPSHSHLLALIKQDME